MPITGVAVCTRCTKELLLIFVVLVRLVTRRLWVADLLGALVMGAWVSP